MTHKRQPTKHIPARDEWGDMDEFESPGSPWLEFLAIGLLLTIIIGGLLVVLP